MNFYYSHISVPYSTIIRRHPSAADGSRNRDPQPVVMQRVRGLGILSANRMVPSNSSSQSSGKTVEEEMERVKEPVVMEDSKNTISCKTTGSM